MMVGATLTGDGGAHPWESHGDIRGDGGRCGDGDGDGDGTCSTILKRYLIPAPEKMSAMAIVMVLEMEMGMVAVM